MIVTVCAILCIVWPSWIIIGISYDRCMVNNIIDGNQCTIYWYVDDNKVLHIDEEVDTKIVETIAENLANSP